LSALRCQATSSIFFHGLYRICLESDHVVVCQVSTVRLHGKSHGLGKPSDPIWVFNWPVTAN